MNRVCLTGRITKEPEIKYSQSGTAFMGFTLAVNRIQKDANGQNMSDFITCKVFGKTAEFIHKYVNKGNMLSIEGSIQTGKYTNSNGQDVYTTDVMVERVENLTPRDNNSNQQQPVQTNQVNNQHANNSDIEVRDDDLPF